MLSNLSSLKILSFGKELNSPKEKGFWKHCGKGENAAVMLLTILTMLLSLLLLSSHQGGSVVSMSDSWPGGCEVNPWLKRTFLFSPLTSAKSCWWFWKEKLCLYWCEKARKHRCVTDRHDMTLSVNVVLNPNTTNRPNDLFKWCSTLYFRTKFWTVPNWKLLKTKLYMWIEN